MPIETELLYKKRAGTDRGLDTRLCEWPKCSGEGIHRAPISPNELNEFRWFCTVHVREYNRSWNYYDGMSEDEVEADVRNDTVWRRPTWRLGSNDPAHPDAALNFDTIHDPFDILGNARPKRAAKPAQEQSFNADQRRALAIFDLESPGNSETIKQRYKELVKRHHPDANGASANSDEKIKDVNHAYQILMDFVGG